MEPIKRVVLVTRQTRLEEECDAQGRSEDAARFVIESTGGSFEPYLSEHHQHEMIVSAVRRAVPRTIELCPLMRDHLNSFVFTSRDLVIVIGPDGLFVNVAKYVHGPPILTFNPLSQSAVLMRFTVEQVSSVITDVFRGTFETEDMTLVEAVREGQVPILGVNELMVGRCDPESAYYTLRHRGRKERQCSSGILISTGCGSTAQISSVFNSAQALVQDGKQPIQLPFSRDSRRLLYVVREPFKSSQFNPTIMHGWIEDGEDLVVLSEMARGGAVYSDGMYRDAREFLTGTSFSIRRSRKTARRIVSTPSTK